MPFYVALPSPTIDWEIEDGAAIPIEQRDPREVTHIAGWTEDGRRVEVRLTPADSPAANYAFDVTPARLVTGADHRARRLPGLARRPARPVPGAPPPRRVTPCRCEERSDEAISRDCFASLAMTIDGGRA